jgi:hypothetical protein
MILKTRVVSEKESNTLYATAKPPEPLAMIWLVGPFLLVHAVKRCLAQGPGRSLGPKSISELVLDVEQPDPDRGCKQRDRHTESAMSPR